MNNFGLYVIITNPTLSFAEIAKICVQNKVEMLQLRLKNCDDKTIVKAGKEISEITKNTETNFIMNDRVDLALVCEADGVHLGQDDIDIDLARKIAPNLLYGLSTHSIVQAEAALRQNPDYIGFGPIYKTPTKEIPDPVVGTENLKKVLEFSKKPVVAIGGIDDSNIDEVINAGAKNICPVRYLMETIDLEKRIIKLNQKLKKER